MENNQKFNMLIGKIEEYLCSIAGKSDFPVLLNKASQKKKIISLFSNELANFYKLRNFTHHENRDSMILIKEEVIQKLEKILELIKNSPKASIFNKKVYYCDIDDIFYEILKIMKERTYTHIPVYDKNVFIGVLSEACIVNWLANKKNVNLENIKIKDLKSELINQPNEFFDFVSENEEAFNIRERFFNEVKNNKRLGALFITKNGQREEELLGIITAWDLPLLDIKFL